MANPNSVKKKEKKTKENFNVCELSYEALKQFKKTAKEYGKVDVTVAAYKLNLNGKLCEEVLSFNEVKAIKKFSKENDKQDVLVKFSRNSGIGVTVKASICDLVVDVTDYDKW